MFWLSASGSNVYFVRSGLSWVLIDTSWPNRGQVIKQTAERLFGAGTRPAAILLTHTHGDHSGSALELARSWDLPVYVHPGELPLAAGKYLPQYGDPIGRWLIGPLMRLMPRRAARMAAKASITEAAQAFNPEAGVPGLPDWECIPTPGHTPGHVCFFRPGDRVLITGDAVLTLNFNSLRDLLRWKQRVSGPPWISTWNWPAAKQSVAALARLDPQVLAPGHGTPMTDATAAKLRALAESLNARPGQRKQLPTTGIRGRAEGRRAHGSVNRLADAENPLVQQTAARLSQGCRSSREQVERFVSFVRDDIKFGFPPAADWTPASETLQLGIGQCNTKGTPHAPNTVGNFCFEVTLGYRRVERGR